MSDEVRNLLYDPVTKILIVLYVEMICGIIAGGLASDRGRRPWPAFLIGFFASVFGVCAVAFSDHDDDRHTPSAGSCERWTRRLGWALIVAAAAIAYCNSFTVPLVFDGANYLLDNEKIRLFRRDDFFDALRDLENNPDRWNDFAGFAQTRIVCYLTFAFDHGFYRYDVEFWHRTSFLIHVVAALALYGIGRHGLLSPRFNGRYEQSFERLSLAVALLWVVHPLNTQSVTYLYQRLESLMGMFYMLTVFACARASRASSWQRAWCWCSASVVFCALGMASKEVMVTAPLVTLWYDRVFLARSWGGLLRRRTVYYLALFATLGISVLLMRKVFNHETENYEKAGIADPLRQSPQEYAITQLSVIKYYLEASLAPTQLNIDHAWRETIDWDEWPDTKWPFFHTEPKNFAWGKYVNYKTDEFKSVTIPAMIVGGLVLLTLIAIFVNPPLGFLGGSFFVVLAPTSSFVPIVDYCFEHRTYVSLALVVALAVVSLDATFEFVSRRLKFISSTTAAVAFVILVGTAAGIFTGLTIRRNHDYRSTLALWRDAAEKAPWNHRAQYNHGVYLQRASNETKDVDEQKRLLEQAIVQYYKTIELDPNYAEAYLNLARIYNWRGNLPQAKDMFEKLLRFEGWRHPEYREGVVSLARIYIQWQYFSEAEEMIQRLLRIKDLPPAEMRERDVGLAGIYMQLNRYPDARPWLIRILQLNPTRDEEISWKYQLAFVEHAVGNYDLADRYVAEVLALDPKHTQAPLLRTMIQESRALWQTPP